MNPNSMDNCNRSEHKSLREHKNNAIKVVKSLTKSYGKDEGLFLKSWGTQNKLFRKEEEIGKTFWKEVHFSSDFKDIADCRLIMSRQRPYQGMKMFAPQNKSYKF